MAEDWKNISISGALSWVMKLILIGLLPYELYVGDYLFAVAALIAIIVSLIPAVVERNYRIQLPFELDFLITLAIFLHIVLGQAFMFYDRVWQWDKFLHFYTGGVIAILAFMITYSLHYAGKIRLSIPFIGFFTVVFALAMGSVWEILEFWVDFIFEKQTQTSLTDTMWDLMYDFTGGLIAAVIGMLYVRYSNPKARKRLARPIGDIFSGSNHGAKRKSG